MLDPVRVVQARPEDMPRVVAFPGVPGVGLPAVQVAAELQAGRLRPEWTFVAVADSGALLGRAMWWGRDPVRPIALDVWDVDRQSPDRTSIAVQLLRRGHDALSALGVRVPLPHTIRVPNGWRDDETVADDVAWRIVAAKSVGLTAVNERRQFEWDGGVVPATSDRLAFHPAGDVTFIGVFARAATGSLDVATQRALGSRSALDLARDEFDYYASCPGERTWWRIASNRQGRVVGVAIPSATPIHGNVGYLAVLPEYRGRGYVDDLLAYITGFHAAQGATRVTGTTDVVNAPMAAAFARAGYRHVETRIDLETR